MNRLEIFQQVYGTDHVFTAQELERLRQVAELIVKECASLVQGVPTDTMGYHTADQKIKEHFGVEE